jgi:alkylated DNA repair dioxygenase AlkB
LPQSWNILITTDNTSGHICLSVPARGIRFCQAESCTRNTHSINVDTAASIAGTFFGAHVIENFVTPELEEAILADISAREWAPSQSGRRKLDFGPSVNFKRQKVKLERFNGLPGIFAPVVEAFSSDPRCSLQENGAILEQFNVVECGVIEYDPTHGASIDRHLDDKWLWGERIATLSLAADTVMTFSIDCETELPCSALRLLAAATVESDASPAAATNETQVDPVGNQVDPVGTQVDPIENQVDPVGTQVDPVGISSECNSDSGGLRAAFTGGPETDGPVEGMAPRDAVADAPAAITSDTAAGRDARKAPVVEVRVSLPRRSLLVMAAGARNDWRHAIHREDILERRVSLTFRELAADYLEGGAHEAQGRELVARAARYLP